MPAKSPEKRLDEFMDRFSPEVANRARAVLAKLRPRLSGAIQMVYDNYNGLVVGFGPNERASEAIFSVVLYPRRVTLFFLQGARLPDPHRRLTGKGTVARHIVLEDADDLDDPAVQELMDRALAQARTPLDPAQPGRLVIKSVSAKQRPRRPAK